MAMLRHLNEIMGRVDERVSGVEVETTYLD